MAERMMHLLPLLLLVQGSLMTLLPLCCMMVELRAVMKVLPFAMRGACVLLLAQQRLLLLVVGQARCLQTLAG
jgi:hypothetical protein